MLNPYCWRKARQQKLDGYMGVMVQVPEPEFEGQTKTRLGNPEVRKIVEGIVTQVRHPRSSSAFQISSLASVTRPMPSLTAGCYHSLASASVC